MIKAEVCMFSTEEEESSGSGKVHYSKAGGYSHLLSRRVGGDSQKGVLHLQATYHAKREDRLQHSLAGPTPATDVEQCNYLL